MMSTLANLKKEQLPDGGLKITIYWVDSILILRLQRLFIVLFGAALLYAIFNLDNPAVFVILLGSSLLGLVLTLVAPDRLLDTTVITLKQQTIQVEYRSPLRGVREQKQVTGVGQVYSREQLRPTAYKHRYLEGKRVTERISNQQPRYELHVTTQTGQNHRLIADLRCPARALYLEHVIEEFFKIEDQQAPQEWSGAPKYLERNKRAWQAVAETLGLTFIPANDHEGAYVTSTYQGYSLKLEAFVPNQELYEPHTRVTLTADSPVKGEISAQAGDQHPKQQPPLELMIQELAPPYLASAGKWSMRIENLGQKIVFEENTLQTRINYFRDVFEILAKRIEAYRWLLAEGGEIVPLLQETAARQVKGVYPAASQLLHDIAEETMIRLSSPMRARLCPHCWLRCAPITAPSWAIKITYYGCPGCGQSREFLEVKSIVVAVLDEQVPQPLSQQEDIIYANWLAHRQLFDFDEVHIRQASDEDVERFAVQVGNDTDPVRQPRYATMRCLVSPGCDLSENSLKILQKTFGQVEVEGN